MLSLMVLVALVAVGLAAFKYPTEWDVNVTGTPSANHTLTVGVLLLALVGVAARRGDKRFFWIGLAILGWGYSVHTLRWGNFIEVVPFGFTMENPSPGYCNWFRQTANSVTALLVALLGTVLIRFLGTHQDETQLTEQKGTMP